MSPFATNNLLSSLIMGCPKLLLYFYFVSILTLSPVFSLPARTDVLANTSEYVLRDVFQHKDHCYKDSFIYVKDSDAAKSTPFSVYSTTRECSARLRENDLPAKLPTCPPGLIDLEVTPTYVAKSQMSYSHANLNISVTAHSHVDTIAFRLQCLYASDGSDVYCSDRKEMYINGVKEWPCRGINLSTKVKYPARFSYACFRMTPYSIYTINATVLPQRCRITTIITSPHSDEIFPEIFFEPTVSKEAISAKDPYWSPSISVDFSDDDAIWVRLGKAPKAECDTININVYREHDDDMVAFLEVLTVKCPENAVKWENQKAGKYLLTAYVPIRGCKFHCEPTSRGCRQCLRTHLNLYINEDRASLTWLTVQKFKDYSFEIFIGVSSLCAIFVILMIVGTITVCWRNNREANRVREIRLTEFVRAMIVYSDDNEQHTNCVSHLVENLRHCATCEPIFDLEKLITAEQVVPSRWLVDQLSSLAKFIIVISDCAEKILDAEASETHHLVQSRPFADLFGPAMNIIIRDATHNPEEALQKYVIVRFKYSPQVPQNLAILRLPTFLLPDEFGRLTAFLHNLEYGETVNITQNVSEDRMNQWTRAIDRNVTLSQLNPNWIETRWKPKDEQDVMNLKRETPVTFTYENNEDRIAASKRLNLLPPPPDSEDDEEQQASTSENTFMLRPAPQEEDFEDDDDEEEEGSATIVAMD